MLARGSRSFASSCRPRLATLGRGPHRQRRAWTRTLHSTAPPGANNGMSRASTSSAGGAGAAGSDVPSASIDGDGSGEVVFTTSAEDQQNIAALKRTMAEKAAAAKALADSAADLPPAATVVPHVDITPGRFKYVLMEAHDVKSGKVTQHTRSGPGSYHADVADAPVRKFHDAGFKVKVKGGGRIDFDPDARRILIFGYSIGFGMADHSISAEMIRGKYGGTFTVETSNEGY